MEHRDWININNPTSWYIIVNSLATVVAEFQSGSTNGFNDIDKVCARSHHCADFTEKRLWTLPGRDASIPAPKWVRMAWTPDGTILALSSLDRVYIVRFFGHDHLDDGSQPVLLATFIELGGQVCSISLSQKGSLLNLYVLLFGSRLLRFPVPTGMVRAVFRATDLNPASMDIFQWNPAVCCMQLLDDTLVVGGATLSNRPCVSVFTLGEAGISATDPVAVHVWSSSKGGDSSSSSSISSLPYAAVCSLSLQHGSKAIALLTNGATLSVNTSSHAPGVSMLRLGGSGSITSVEWISEDQVAVADVHKGFVEIIRLPAAAATAGGRGREEEGDRETERLLRKEFSWPQVTRGHAGRFFILTAVQHRRPIHPVITAEKLREWQKKEDHAQTFWGSLKRSLYSYVEYFHVPQLNLAPSLWEIEQLSSLVQYESLSAAAMVERKVASEEYDEALALAKEHDLPCDEIHKRRWLHQVSLAPQTSKDMEETLGRVNDCVWVLQQCLNFEGRNGVEERSLLQFALSLLSDNSRSGSTLSPILKSAYELMFVDRLHRLESYLELSEFDSKDFFNFVRQDLALAVLVHARHGRVAVVRTLMKRHAGAVLPFRLHILSAFPETTPLTDLKPLLPSVVDGFEKLWTSVPVPRFEEEVLRGLRQAVRRGDITLGGEDWDEVLKALLFPRESVRIHSTSFTPTASLQLSADEIGAWWSKRVLEVDESSGQLDIALALAKEGLARGVPGLELLLQRLEELNLLVYRFGGASLRLRSYCEASEYQRCAGFLSVLDPSGANLSEVLEVVRLHFAPSVLVQHLRRYGVHCAQSMQTLSISVLLLKRSVPSVPVEQRPFAQVSDLLECALEFAYSCPDAKAHVVWMDVVRVLPTRLTHQGDAVLEVLHDRLDALEADLEACAILERLGLPTSVSGLSSGGGDGDGDGDGEALLGRVMSLAGKRRRTSPAEWNALLRDLLQLRQSVFKRLSSEKIYASYVRTLVAAREFSLVSKVSKECGASFEEAVVSAAWELFDASSALDDAGVEGARQALALVEAAGLDEPPSAERAKLTALCEVARWLAQLGVQMIPLQMKPWAGQTTLDAFARVQEAIRKSRLLPPADLIGSDRAETLASLLGCSGQGRLVLEAIGLSLISHGRAAQVEAQAITLGSCLLARRLVLSGAWSPASLDVLRTMMGLALSGCPSNTEMGRLLDRGRVLEMDFLRQYGDAVSPDPEPVVGALGRDRCAVAENLRRGPLQIVAISDAPSQWTDEILLTAASGSDFDTAMRLFDKCTSVKVPAMWLSSRERTKCLCEYVSKHPGHNLEPLIPADASNDDDDPYARLDVNLVRDPKGSSSVTNNNIPNNNNNDDAEKEPEDIGQLAKAVWGKLW